MPTPRHRNEVVFPARDESFAAIVADLSGRATGPPADNFVSNEDSFPRVVGELARRTPPGGVYLGVGPDQNFSYIAAARPVVAFVLDHRRRNLLLHLLHKALFELSADRAGYLTRLFARRPGPLPRDPSASELVAAFEAAAFDRVLLEATVAEVARVVDPLGVVGDGERPELATIQRRIAGPGMSARFLALPMYPTFGRLIRTADRDGRPAHLLAREASYRAVRDLQRGDRVVPLVGDFAAPGALAGLASWLLGRGLAVSLLYVSDVEFFLLRAGRFGAYVENLAALPWVDGALVVRTSTREIDHPDRIPGDSATTVVRTVAPFLAAARSGRIGTVDVLFAD
jgi:hypothetical protein